MLYGAAERGQVTLYVSGLLVFIDDHKIVLTLVLLGPYIFKNVSHQTKLIKYL